MRWLIIAPLVTLVTLATTHARAHDIPREFADFVADVPASRAAAVPDADAFARVRSTPGDWQRARTDGTSLLMLAAARRGDWAAAAGYLKAGANPNARDAALDGSALALAAADGQTEFVRKLLAAGADPDQRGEAGFTPLGIAALRGHLPAVRLLLREGADPDRKGADGAPPIVNSVRMDRDAVMDALLAAGADPLVPDRDGVHALGLAAARGDVAMIERLLAHGVPVDARDGAGRTALFWARLYRRQRVLAILLGAGADEKGTVPLR